MASSTSSTLTRPARSATAKPATAKPAPARPARKVTVPEVLKGVVVPAATPKAKPTRATANGLAEMAKAVASEKVIKVAKPKSDVNDRKRALASLIVVAAGEAIAKAKVADLGNLTALELAAQWLHYLPVGSSWPEGQIPVPDRSDWNDDGTRV